MKKILASLFCFCCCSAMAQTGQELIDNGKNSENVTTFGMGYNLNQYSQLSQNKASRAETRGEFPILRCRGSNPAAPTGQSFSNAYEIGSRRNTRRSSQLRNSFAGLVPNRAGPAAFVAHSGRCDDLRWATCTGGTLHAASSRCRFTTATSCRA